jgi:hypothetical protein
LRHALCAYPSLMSDAQAQAQRMASAAGFKVGALVSISDQATVAPTGTFAFLNVLISGDFSQTVVNPFLPVSGLANLLLGSVAAQAPTTCTMTVQFQLVQ